MEKTVRVYKAAAVVLLNLIVLFFLVNLGLWVLFGVKDFFYGKSNPVYRKYGQTLEYEKVYPGLSKQERDRLLKETWENRPLTFERFTQFKERAYQGKYVNVSGNGYRLTGNQGSWPPGAEYFNLFFFGGSTAFGYGVADDRTIASYLQEFLNSRPIAGKEVRVYNFGRSSYYSSLERLLYEKLLVYGRVPDLALFLDGMNDFYFYDDLPHFSKKISKLVKGTLSHKPAHPFLEFLQGLPIGRAAAVIKSRIAGNSFPEKAGKPNYNDKLKLLRVCKRYLETKKIIEAVSEAYGVKPVFVWQPVPTYKYDLKYHLFAGFGDFLGHNYSKFGYPLMADFIKDKDLGNSFIWLADMQEDSREPLYVDQIHYSAKMNKKIAQGIYRLLVEKKLLN